jgi:hypothetical protein
VRTFEIRAGADGLRFAIRVLMPPQRFVDIRRSERDPARYYTGLTSNLRLRLADHNAARSCTPPMHDPGDSTSWFHSPTKRVLQRSSGG